MPLEVGAGAVVTTMSSAAKHGTSAEVLANAAAARAAYKSVDGPTVWGKFLNPVTGKPTSEPSTAASRGGDGGATEIGGFPVITSRSGGPSFVSAGDLVCGGVISVFGRPLLIKSCDPYTVAFGIHKLGIDQRRTFIKDHISLAGERATAMPLNVPRGPVSLPPHEGALAIGSELETRINAKKIVPFYRSANNFDRA